MQTYEVTEQQGQAGHSEEAIRTEIVQAESAREAILSVFGQPKGWVFEDHLAVTSMVKEEDAGTNRSGMYVHYYMACPVEAEADEDSE